MVNANNVLNRPLHNLLNRIDGWSESGSTFKGVIGARAANLVVAVPTELGAVAQNVLLTPVQAAGIILGLGARVVAFISGSATVKQFQESMPGLTDFLRTVARIVAFSIGTGLTATVGVVSPTANFKAQCALGLVYSEKQEAEAREAEIKRLAQLALIAKRNDQIASDLKAVEQLPHETAANESVTVNQSSDDANTVIVDEAVTNDETVEEENPYAGISDLFAEPAADDVAAARDEASVQANTLGSRIKAAGSSLKDAVVNHKLALSGIITAAAGAFVYYSQYVVEAVAEAATEAAEKAAETGAV